MPPLRGLLQLFEAPLKVDAATQTVTHVVERLIDVNYEWNEWALRRRVSEGERAEGLELSHSCHALLPGQQY
jgi:hypothetical protein